MTTLREELIEELEIRLGGGLVDVELDPKHYDLAVTMAIRRYRQRSSNALEESFVFLKITTDQPVYTLPREIQEVRAVYRANMGAAGNGGAAVDPFGAAFVNNIYMVQNPSGMPGGSTGTLALYDFAMQYQELVGRMFGRDLQYTWNAATKKISFHRRFRGEEEVALHCYLTQPEEVLLSDSYARPWVQDYALALCKLMLGEGRGKWSSMAGPQGGISLNGDALKTEAQAEMERLDKELKDGVDSAIGYGFIIG